MGTHQKTIAAGMCAANIFLTRMHVFHAALFDPDFTFMRSTQFPRRHSLGRPDRRSHSRTVDVPSSTCTLPAVAPSLGSVKVRRRLVPHLSPTLQGPNVLVGALLVAGREMRHRQRHSQGVFVQGGET